MQQMFIKNLDIKSYGGTEATGMKSQDGVKGRMCINKSWLKGWTAAFVTCEVHIPRPTSSEFSLEWLEWGNQVNSYIRQGWVIGQNLEDQLAVFQVGKKKRIKNQLGTTAP